MLKYITNPFELNINNIHATIDIDNYIFQYYLYDNEYIVNTFFLTFLIKIKENKRVYASYEYYQKSQAGQGLN